MPCVLNPAASFRSLFGTRCARHVNKHASSLSRGTKINIGKCSWLSWFQLHRMPARIQIAMLHSLNLLRLMPLEAKIKFVRQIRIDRLSNKKITRLESHVELEDDEFKSRLINRNPRNLEQMSFEKKPTGYWLDKSPKAEWNKLVFDQTGGHLSACLVHWSGKRIIQTSTKEPQLAKYFRSPNTVQAATILGQIMSRRLLQSGYLYAAAEDVDADSQGVKLKAFYEAVKLNGFVLEEPPEIEPRTITDL